MNSKSTVVFYINPMSYNNLSKYDYNLLTGMGDELDLHYLCSKDYDFKPINNAKMHLLFKYKDKRNIGKLLSYLVSLCHYLRLLVKLKPQTVHIQWFKFPIFDLCFLVLSKCITSNTKYIHTAHNVLPHCPKIGDRFIYKYLYKLLDNIICHTELSKKELVEFAVINPNCVITIPHGLLEPTSDIDGINRVSLDIVKKHQLEDKFIFEAIGIHNHYKGTDRLLRLWDVVFKDNPKFVLIIAGRNANEYRQFCFSKNVIFMDGFLSNNEFDSLINISNVMVLPYRQISQSGVLLSILSHKKAFIVSNVGGLTDPLGIANVGWEFDSASDEAFCEILKQIKDKPDIASHYANDSEKWNKLHKFYDWHKISNTTKYLYFNH